MLPTGWPRTSTWLPVSELGLSRMGFIRTSGSSRQAWAWTTWARPISPPARVTNELSDMFWALNGATRRPSWKRMRHSAAVRMLLPALELVPWSIRAGVFRGSWWGSRPCCAWCPSTHPTMLVIRRASSASARASQSRRFSAAVRTATRKNRPSRPCEASKVRMAMPAASSASAKTGACPARSDPAARGGNSPRRDRRRAPAALAAARSIAGARGRRRRPFAGHIPSSPSRATPAAWASVPTDQGVSCRADLPGDVLIGHGVAQSQPRNRVELGERADDDDVCRRPDSCVNRRGQSDFRADASRRGPKIGDIPVVGQRDVAVEEIGECFINDEQRRRSACRQRPELPAVEGQSGGIVGLSQHHEFPAVQLVFQGGEVEDEAGTLVERQQGHGATSPLDGRRIVDIGRHGDKGPVVTHARASAKRISLEPLATTILLAGTRWRAARARANSVFSGSG